MRQNQLAVAGRLMGKMTRKKEVTFSEEEM